MSLTLTFGITGSMSRNQIRQHRCQMNVLDQRNTNMKPVSCTDQMLPPTLRFAERCWDKQAGRRQNFEQQYTQ